jgi:hypothetical protein
LVEIHHRWLISTGIFSASKKSHSTILFASKLFFSTVIHDDYLRRMRVCVFLPKAIIGPLLEQRLLPSLAGSKYNALGAKYEGGKRKYE